MKTTGMPKGYEIDHEKSQIVFKKAEETLKVPFWGWYKGGNGDRLVRVTDISTDGLWHTCDIGMITSEYFQRLATPEEIKAHLIVQISERYPDGMFCEISFPSRQYPVTGHWSYNEGYDMLQNNGYIIYESGTWAKPAKSYPTWEELLDEEITSCARVYFKLLRIAAYLNRENKTTYYRATAFYSLATTPFKVKAIFKANGSEQDLIDYFK